MLVICLLSLRRAEYMCADMLRLGVHVTVLALLFPHSASHAFACSLNALMYCSWAMCRDEVSACVQCLFMVGALSWVAHTCPSAIGFETQLNALLITDAVDLASSAMHRLIWSGLV